MFNGGETVQVIANGRVGKVGASGVVGGPISWLTVHFQDGKQPLVDDFKADELRLVDRPGEGGPPGLVPKDPVV